MKGCNCEAQAPGGFLTSGERQDGERWTCPSCGKVWEHICDESEGCRWERAVPMKAIEFGSGPDSSATGGALRLPSGEIAFLDELAPWNHDEVRRITLELFDCYPSRREFAFITTTEDRNWLLLKNALHTSGDAKEAIRKYRAAKREKQAGFQANDKGKK